MSHSAYKDDMGLDERVMMAMVRAAERFRKEQSAIFKKHGLSFSQYNVLRVLDASTDGRNTIKRVNRIMLVSGANMTGITKRLEKMGCIVRTSDSDDERLKWLEITDKGRGLLCEIYNEKEKDLRRYLDGYGDEEKIEILEVLTHIVKGKRKK